MVILAWEERLPTKHLRKDATHTPNVNSFGVFLEGKHNLGGAIPPSRNVLRHEARVVFYTGSAASKTKVANLEITVGIEEEIGGFQVAMKNIGAVHGLEGAEGLVDEVLAMIVGEILGANDTVHIRFHELLDKIHLRKRFVVAGLLDVKNADDVLMVKVPEKLHLAKRSETEHAVVEGRNFLYGNLVARWLVKSRTVKLIISP